jgi:short-subunit dehydrogenase
MMNEEKNIAKPIVIITGGTSGIGLSIARHLSSKFHLALIYKSDDARAIKARNMILEINPSAVVVIVRKELIDYTSAECAFDQITKSLGFNVFALINCAGHTKSNLFLTTNFDEMVDTFNSHFFGVLGISKIVVENMLTYNTHGRIINFSSIASHSNRKGMVAYAAAKSAIESFTKSLSIELAHKNISVNCLKPGLLEDQHPNSVDNRVSKITYNEITNFIDFLLLDNTTTLTGNIFEFDTGYGRNIL